MHLHSTSCRRGLRRGRHSSLLTSALAGEGGGEAAEVRGADARQGDGGAAAAGRGARQGLGTAVAGLVILFHPLALARLLVR